jgi:predicted glycosyltransferase/uncharacterized protein YbjT (DUF2867 family)
MSTYLVTGAAGFIGSHLSERLLSNGHIVRGADRFSDYYGRDVKEANIASCRARPGFELIEADFADADLDGLLRYFTVYGPRQRPDMAFMRFLRAALSGEPLRLLGDGTQSRDFSYVSDVVDATIRSLAAPRGRIYNVAGGEPTSLNAVVDILESLLDRALVVEREQPNAGDVRHTWSDTSRARHELGWMPQTTLLEGLGAQLAWLNRAAPAAPAGTHHADRHRIELVTGGSSARTSLTERRPRVLTYSHDGFGLGHFRRNIRLVDALAAELPGTAALMLTGSPASHYFQFPEFVDYLKLPSLAKVANDRYVSRSLGIDADRVSSMRSALAMTAAIEFEPDVVLVDHYPLGVGRELEPMLRRIRADLPGTRIILGWRDILDRPARVNRTWRDSGQIDAINRFYDQVLIYGCRDLYDPLVEYRLPGSVASRVTFTGYLVDQAIEFSPPDSDQGRMAVCVLGGGEDGQRTAQVFIDAMTHLRPSEWSATLVTGPLMAAETFRRLDEAALQIGVRCLRFVDDVPALLRAANVVVAMGGYNTICEILAAGTPAVIIPRTIPREEQLLRARLLAARGLVSTLHPAKACGARLAALIKEQSALDRMQLRAQRASSLDMTGLHTAAGLLAASVRSRAAVPA